VSGTTHSAVSDVEWFQDGIPCVQNFVPHHERQHFMSVSHSETALPRLFVEKRANKQTFFFLLFPFLLCVDGSIDLWICLYCIVLLSRAVINHVLTELDEAGLNHPAVLHACQVNSSVALGNYAAFFQLYESAPNMSAHIMRKIDEGVRAYAIKVLCRRFVRTQQRFIILVDYVSVVVPWLIRVHLSCARFHGFNMSSLYQIM
jgi:hypothetical protein